MKEEILSVGGIFKQKDLLILWVYYIYDVLWSL